MHGHSDWLNNLLIRAKADQKTFRIVNLASGREDVDSIDISVMQDSAQQSSADQTGWMVDIRYQNAPDSVLFTQVYPTEDQARKVFSDLSLVAAEVEGLIKAEKFEEARAKTEELTKKFAANSGQTPVAETSSSDPK